MRFLHGKINLPVYHPFVLHFSIKLVYESSCKKSLASATVSSLLTIFVKLPNALKSMEEHPFETVQFPF